MIIFILKSTLSLLVLFGFYWTVLRREKLLKFNRYFLLASLCFSMLIPFVTIKIENETPGGPENIITTFNNYLPQINVAEREALPAIVQSADEKKSLSLSIFQIMMIIYITGVALFLSRFLRNIFLILCEIKRSEKVLFSGYRVVLTEKNTNPYCFFNSIFIHKNDYNKITIDKNLLNHELGHIKQHHSADIVFFELVRIFYWFNPVLILYNNAIRLNHEYLADESVLGDSGDIESYADKLLNFTDLNRRIALVSGFNYSLVKKRLIMIAQSRSGKINDLVRIATTLAIAFLLFLIMSCEQKDQQDINMMFIPQGQFISTAIHGTDTIYDAIISVDAFWMSNEITNREYREFVNYIRSNPDKLLYQVVYKQDEKYLPGEGTTYGPTTLIIDPIKYSSIAVDLIDSTALERIYTKYKNYLTSKKYDNYPVTGITQKQATWFCIWKTDMQNEKSAKEGTMKLYTYRLPLEAEWEYAAQLSDTIKVMDAKNNRLMESDKGTDYGYGLFHLGDNVSEWLEGHGTPGIIRGGSWETEESVEKREKTDPAFRDGTIGFRIVRSYSAEESDTKQNLEQSDAKVFSGKWEINKEKSVSFVKEIITQTLTIDIKGDLITIEGQIILPDREPLAATRTYISDGGTLMSKNGDKIETVSCFFPEDKKSFTITTRLVYPYGEMIRKATRFQTFSLTDNNRTLIVNYIDSLPEGSITPRDERNFNLVYYKK